MRAAGLARRSGARVVMVHVVSPESAPVDFDGLQRTVAPLLEGIEVQPLLRRGPVAREILAAARSENADLIVLTRHGRWQSASDLGFSRFLLHSMPTARSGSNPRQGRRRRSRMFSAALPRPCMTAKR